LSELLSRLVFHVSRESIIVVDDGSTDSTGRIAREFGARVIQHGVNRGKGAALRSGFEYVLQRPQWNSVITLDADLQHDPDEIPKFVARSKQGNVDIIVGNRRRAGSGMPFHRLMSNTITSMLVGARAGLVMKDSQSGFRWISRKVLSTVSIESDGFEAETEFLIKAARKSFTIDFVPIATIYGKETSHMTHWQTTRRFLQVLMKEY
jgi:glycosyltransferase involved in cell wall biosynthesis